MLGLATLNEITEGDIHSSHQFSSVPILGHSTEISVLFFFFLRFTLLIRKEPSPRSASTPISFVNTVQLL